METVPQDLISEIDLLLGLKGRPYIKLANGQWLDTGCYEWNSYPSAGLLWTGATPELKQAMARAGEHLARVTTSADAMATIREYILENNPGVCGEYDELMRGLQQAEKRLSQPIDIVLPEIPPDVKEAMDRIHDQVNKELGTSENFNFNEFADRVHQLWQEEPEDLRSSLERIRPDLERISAAPKEADDQRKHRLEKVRALLRGRPFVAYDDIIVAPAKDQYDILRVEETNGANRGLLTEDIIAELTELDRQHGVTIRSAGFDFVTFNLNRVPTGEAATRLGESLLRLCPDLGEAAGDFSQGIELWWD